MNLPSAAIPRLHVITDHPIASDPRFVERAESVLAAGGARVALHLRTREMGGAALLALLERLVGRARAAGARLLINDRVDVAMAAGADGVQLPEHGIPVADARRLAGARALIGASVHSVAAAKAAAEAGADFVIAGTIYPSGSHPGGPVAGTGLLEALRPIALPVIAIGGVDATRVPEVRRSGAHGVAVRAAIWNAARPDDAVGQLLDILAGAE